MDVVRVSKRLSYVLRHRPESLGLTLDAGGWVDVDSLLRGLAAHGMPLEPAELKHVVDTDDKRRFALDSPGARIRACQGHSVAVELGYQPVPPPPELFHGTVARFLDPIRRDGLRPGGRHAVHLSPDRATARAVGARRGRPVVLRVDAEAMADAGYLFSRSANGVWLVDAVPPRYLTVETGDAGS
ncbi:RNA 2'-phosphotransferase [Geodermatophilus sp. SYSU D00815]